MSHTIALKHMFFDYYYDKNEHRSVFHSEECKVVSCFSVMFSK